MYTSTMTPEEIDRETNAEVKNIIAKTNNMNKVFRRKVLKATKFPVTMTYEQHTVRKNRWIVTLSAMSKGNTMGRTIMHFYCISESPQGKFIYIPMPSKHRPKGEHKTIVFKPHFFSRYRERMGTEYSGEELIQRLIDELEVVNFIYNEQPDGRIELIFNMQEGQGFGEAFYKKNILLIRTFVPKKMLFNDQIPIYEDGLAERKKKIEEAHEELYNFDRNKKKAEKENEKELSKYDADMQAAREAFISSLFPNKRASAEELFSAVRKLEMRPDLFPPEMVSQMREMVERIEQIDIEKEKRMKELEELNREEERNKQMKHVWWFKPLYMILLIIMLPWMFLWNLITGKAKKKDDTKSKTD